MELAAYANDLIYVEPGNRVLFQGNVAMLQSCNIIVFAASHSF